MKKPIDIIIRSWNAVEYTLLTIASIIKNTRIPYKITIVDDGSDINTLKILRSLNTINLIEHQTNFGPAQVGITGFQNTKSPITVLMDNDVIVPEKWLENMLPYFDNHNVAICAPLKTSNNYKYPGTNKTNKEVWETIKKQNLPPLHALAAYTDGDTLVNFGKKITTFNSLKDQEILAPPGFVSGCCLVVDRIKIIQAGGIARSIFRSYGGEDVDLCWRIGKLGFKIIKTPKVYVHHIEHASVDANRYNYQKSIVRNNQLLYNLWGEEILAQELPLLQKMSRIEIDNTFPLISIFKSIKN